jgi:hypothetical protein
VTYAALCAALVLYTDVRYLGAGLDLALAAGPLVVGMGVVEWRAQCFVRLAGDLLDRHDDLTRFRRGLWELLLRELAACLAVLGALAAALMALLSARGLLTFGGALLVDAHVLLGGVFFLGFVLARHWQFPSVLAGLGSVVALDVLAVETLSGRFPPPGEVPVFLTTTVVLLALLIAAFAAGTRRIQLFHW